MRRLRENGCAWFFRFVRGDQYAVALGLLDDGLVVAGVLGCPNLPMESIANGVPASSGEPIGCLFAASKGAGATVESLDGSVKPKPVGDSNLFNICLAYALPSCPNWRTLSENIFFGYIRVMTLGQEVVVLNATCSMFGKISLHACRQCGGLNKEYYISVH